MFDWKYEFFRDIEISDDYMKSLTNTHLENPRCDFVNGSPTDLTISDRITAELLFHALRQGGKTLLVGTNAISIRMAAKINSKNKEYSQRTGKLLGAKSMKMSVEDFYDLTSDKILNSYDFIYFVADDSNRAHSLYNDIVTLYLKDRFCRLKWFHFKLMR